MRRLNLRSCILSTTIPYPESFRRTCNTCGYMCKCICAWCVCIPPTHACTALHGYQGNLWEMLFSACDFWQAWGQAPVLLLRGRSFYVLILR